jgi:NADPH:quinone reductase-like Zn-dependent oxidoreductase
MAKEFIECHSSKEDLELVSDWMKQDKLKIDVDGTFAIRDLEKAMMRQNMKSKLGRVVLQVKDRWKK